MKRAGFANLPLHYGKAPAWLFEKMKILAGKIIEILIMEKGKDVFLQRLADPFWFQSFGSLLGFDWHSSGLTTTVCGAIKEGLKGKEKDIGIFPCGGKGGRSRKTPEEIENFCSYIGLNATPLVYASRISAKIDSAVVQDGYELYHHCFFFSSSSAWCVVQQGMNVENHSARRYHWLSQSIKSFTEEPHSAICCDFRGETLNLVSIENRNIRQNIVSLLKEPPYLVENEIKKIPFLELPQRHIITMEDISKERMKKIFLNLYENPPSDFEGLVSKKGVGAKTLRALSLTSELIFGTKIDWRDPARFSFAHGGKDGIPYPVSKETYSETIETLKDAVEKAKIGEIEKIKAIKRLAKFK